MSTYVFTLHVQHNLALVLGTNYLILSYPWTSRHTRPNTYFLIFPPSASSKNMMLADVYLSIKSYVPRPNKVQRRLHGPHLTGAWLICFSFPAPPWRLFIQFDCHVNISIYNILFIRLTNIENLFSEWFSCNQFNPFLFLFPASTLAPCHVRGGIFVPALGGQPDNPPHNGVMDIETQFVGMPSFDIYVPNPLPPLVVLYP